MKEQLIAANKSVEEICDYIGADSLAYISMRGMREACGEGAEPNYCVSCYTGIYPSEFIPVDQIQRVEAAEKKL